MSLEAVLSPRYRPRCNIGRSNRAKDEEFSPITHNRRYTRKCWSPKIDKPENLKPLRLSGPSSNRPLTPPYTRPTFRSTRPLPYKSLPRHIYDNLRQKIKEKEQNYIIEIFRNFDLDHNNRISREEFIEGVKFLHVEITAEEAEQLMNIIDPNHKDEIDFERFINDFKKLSPPPTPEIDRNPKYRTTDDPLYPMNVTQIIIDNDTVIQRMIDHLHNRANCSSAFHEFTIITGSKTAEKANSKELIEYFKMYHLDVTDESAKELIELINNHNSNKEDFNLDEFRDFLSISAEEQRERLHPRDLKPRKPHDFTKIPDIIERLGNRKEVTDLLPHNNIKVRQLFISLDKNKDGYISNEDFHKFLNKLPLEDGEANELIELLDSNKDGYIDEADLMEVLTPICTVMNGTGFVAEFKRPLVIRRHFWREKDGSELPIVPLNRYIPQIPKLKYHSRFESTPRPNTFRLTVPINGSPSSIDRQDTFTTTTQSIDHYTTNQRPEYMRSYYERNKGMWERIARSQKINDARLAERVNKDELKRKRTTQGNLEKIRRERRAYIKAVERRRYRSGETADFTEVESATSPIGVN